MQFVLLSGGSGKRLWPLSSDVRPKQFLKLLTDEDNQAISMVQRVWRQLAKNDLTGQTVIATNAAQVELMTSQLGVDVPLVLEPEKRGTFPAIALAATYLYSEKGCQLDEVVSILPVDPLVEDRFFKMVKALETPLLETNAEIALLGVKPTSASEKFGYIVPETNDSDEGWQQVNYFKEKPVEAVAIDLIEKGGLWNCGVFAFKLKYMIDLLEARGLPTDYEQLSAQYEHLPANSFDYEVVEEAKEVVVIEYDGSWKDLGTWNTLTDEMDGKIFGKGTLSEDALDSNIVNELDIPITVLGAKNMIVAASPEGILVTDRDASPRVKNYLAQHNERPMYEERRWGWYRVLEYTKYKEGNEILTKRIGITAGKNLSYQIHYERSEFWTITKGEGIFVLNDELQHVRAGHVLHIPLAAKHAIKAITDMEIIEVQTGSKLKEDDIVRITLDWDETVAYCREPQLE